MTSLPPGIVFVTPWFGAFAGGVERLVHGLASGLFERGVAVRVLTTTCRSPYDDWWTDHHRPGVTRSPDGFIVERHATGPATWRSRYRAAEAALARGEELDEGQRNDFFLCGCVAPGLPSALGPWLERGWAVVAAPYYQGLTHAVARAWPGRVTVIPCLHEEPPAAWPETRHLLATAARVVFLSPEERLLGQELHGGLGRRLALAPAVGAPVPPPPAVEPVADPAPFVCVVGRREPGKGLPELVAWHCDLAASEAAWPRLVVCGGGAAWPVPSHPAIEDRGFLTRAELTATVAGSLALVSLSRLESFSLVLMEAWLVGRPVIVHAGSRVAVGHVARTGGGTVVDGPQSYAAAVARYRDDPGLAAVHGAAGRAHVRRHFHPDVVLESVLAALGSDG